MSGPSDGWVKLSYNPHERDASFKDEVREYTVCYTVHAPATTSSAASPLPLLILCHPFNNSRHYWQPQIDDEQLAPFTKVAVDAVGFARSRTTPAGSEWSYDVAAASILAILDKELKPSQQAVLIGDSMGGAHTGLRAGMRDVEQGGKRLAGLVICGTAAEEESADFSEEYLRDADNFAKQCQKATTSEQVASAIDEFAQNMALAGYTDSEDATVVAARKYGTKVISDSLKLTLANDAGVLDGTRAGETMKLNYRILCLRKGLIPELACRPSRLGKIQVLVVHGTQDNAYPFDRKYHERTQSAIGDDNAELCVIEGGSHFVTASHVTETDAKLLQWMKRKHIIQEYM
ncbi:hypothetical protein OIV83_002379 [Microbotryomycetes sp. JL201]|nr:hypothetical protein OIV83_002379 [Microbotryomycetes sp. JL201]